MLSNRRIAAASATVVFSLLLAACGQQVATHIEAGETVHAALTSVFNRSTTRMVITGENLPGRASIADGSFSVVITTSTTGGGAADTIARRSVDVSVYHQTTNLVDVREVHGFL